jgi:hypothetical protein
VGTTPGLTLLLPVGDNLVSLTVTDSGGKMDSETVVVEVVDTTPPTIVCPDPIAITHNDPQGVPATDPRIVAFLAGATATDAVDPSPVIVHDAPGGTFPIGVTDVTFTAVDASGNVASCQSAVTVVLGNVPPVAQPDTAVVDEDTTVTIAVLANDSDLNGDTLTVTGLAPAPHGAVSLNADGTVTYAPAADFFGADSFYYVITDGEGGTDWATVSITVRPVNDPPWANCRWLATNEDTAVSVRLMAGDCDGDPLFYTVLTLPTRGTLRGTVPYLIYTPAPDYNGTDRFTYRVSDGQLDSNVATVKITVRPVNDPPQAVDDTAATDEDEAVTIDVLANDTDIDSDTLIVAALTQGANGTTAVNADGTVTYTPNADFNGSDTFAYTMSDGRLDSNVATVAITVHPVNDPPVIVSVSAPVDPLPVGTTVNASATFMDPDPDDTHEALWDWGDGTVSPGTVDETSRTARGSHDYRMPGVYTITVTVTDAAGALDQASFGFIVVYDPSGGFVTGGGWILSPPGACLSSPTLKGKANFGFVSKYKRGAMVPTGVTQFTFHGDGLSFHSLSYQWMTVAGPHVRFQGLGKIDGEGDYGFLVAVTDGERLGGEGVDTFRIIIWDKTTDETIYDNLPGVPESEEVLTPLDGGSIVIHSAD